VEGLKKEIANMSNEQITQEIQHATFGVHEVPPNYHPASLDAPSRSILPGGGHIDGRDLDRAADLPVICVETRHMQAVLKAQINKTDRNDCPRHRADDAGGALSPGACEDTPQPKAADATDSPQATADEGYCR
jgi:hypothetical protein